MSPIIKEHLLKVCREHVENRYRKIEQTISDIEESLLEESKSSSGDKHETGRAMLQIDRENAGRQLMEIEKLLSLLRRMDISQSSSYARLGSLVLTDKFTYFLSMSIGQVVIHNNVYLCVALNSPVGSLLLGKSKGDHFSLNGVEQTITDIR